ncbi:MAG: PQQ-binding-like beta-propeller repeat protein [candidate division WOR-3 bacterium]
MAILLLCTIIVSIPDQGVILLNKRSEQNSPFWGPGNLLWSFSGIDDIECLSPFFDVDGDSVNDVLAESYDAGASGPAHFFCLSGKTGDTIWAIWPSGGVSNSGGWGDQCVSFISDLNDDGCGDALLGTAWGGRTVFAISGRDGNVLWSYNTYNDSIASGWVYCVSSLADVNGDSLPEVLAATGTNCQTVFCFSGADGSIIWRFYAQDALGSVCAIRDVNGDGYEDVIAGAWGNSRDKHIYCISGNSRGNQPQVIWSYEAAGDVYCVRTIVDINRSGKDDVLASTWGNYIYCLEGGTGQLIWRTDIGTYGMRIELLDDINGDSIPEVIVGSWNNAIILLNGRNGEQIWQRPVGNDVWTVYPIGDVNGDGKQDVLGGCGDGNVYCVDGLTGAIIWNYSTGGWVNSVRSISDVNGDKLDDGIAGNQFASSPGYVYCIEGDTITTGLKEGKKKPDLQLGQQWLRVYDPSGRVVKKMSKPGVYFLIGEEKGRAFREKLLILK